MTRPILDPVKLIVEGMTHRGWTSVSVLRTMRAIAGKFDIEVADKWSHGMAARTIRPGDRCQLLLGGEPVITGYIDDVDPSYDATTHKLKIGGRDRTCDLVDCSIVKRPAQWRNRKLEAIATELAQPFGIVVVAGDDTGKPIEEAAAQEGDSPFQLLDKLCKSRNVWPVTDGLGRLTFQRASKIKLPTELKRPGLILRGDANFSDKDRFSEYHGKGQRAGSDKTTPKDHAHASAIARDDGIRRFRPLIVQGEDQHSKLTLADRLVNERNKRIGESRSVDIVVPGWRQPDGELWPVNRIVPLADDWLKTHDDWLIAEATYALSSQGTTTTLKLMPPIAFDLQATSTGGSRQGDGDVGKVDRPWSTAGGPV